MEETNATASFRGPLRYEVETSATQLQAGRRFTVFLKLTNPYDVPVTIMKVETQIPVEFENPILRPASMWSTFKDMVKSEAEDMLNSAKTQNIVAVNLAPNPQENSEVKLQENESTSVTLQPGNSSLQVFIVRTRREISFTPSTYNLHIQIQYKMNGTTNYDTVRYQLNMRAPMKALIWGSIAGSTVGTLLRYFYDHPAPKSLPVLSDYVTFISSALLAATMIIAFARKKDAQPFITIEDFWGGFFVGFVAGYSGKLLADEIIQRGVTGAL